MGLLLERTKSTYFPAFQQMINDLEIGLAEATDISIHLKPLTRLFEKFDEGMDFLELPVRFPAIFHVVALVWANATHYRQPVRLVVLFQEIANLVIGLVSTWLTHPASFDQPTRVFQIQHWDTFFLSSLMPT
jgi:dynein heavy chain